MWMARVCLDNLNRNHLFNDPGDADVRAALANDVYGAAHKVCYRLPLINCTYLFSSNIHFRLSTTPITPHICTVRAPGPVSAGQQ